MISQVHVRYMALALLITFCQVIGTMCALPDLSETQETALLLEDHMACPMDETSMCPPSLTSSPERQMKNNLAEVDHALIPVSFPAILAGRSIQTMWSLDSARSIVPISIESSSVLRI